LDSAVNSLRVLDLSFNRIVSIDFAPYFPALVDLAVDSCCLSSLAGVANFPKLTALSATDNRLTDISDLVSGSLRKIDLSVNSLQKGPAFSELPALIELDTSGNPLREIGSGKAANLKMLRAVGTRIATVSRWSHKFPKLEVCELVDSQINSIDDVTLFTRSATNLRTLNLRGTPLTLALYPEHEPRQ
jgi:Leucine-rich repeat (LRR) protein